MNRRSFLRNGTCGMMSSLPAINTILNMTMAGNIARAQGASAGEDDYKSLICLFLNGGNDSYNMLIPTSGISADGGDVDSEYFWYNLTRSNLAMYNNLRPLNVTNTPGRTFALHHSMPDIANLFNEGKAAFVANIGTLVEPIPSVTAFQSGTYRVPISIGAHNTQQTSWQTGLPQNVSSNTGWFGRAADIINLRENPASALPMSFALSRTKGINQGVNSGGLAIGANGIDLLDNVNLKDKWMKTKFEAQQGRIYQNIMQRVHQQKMGEYSDLANIFQTSFQSTTTSTAFSGGLSANFRAIARTISMRQAFNVKRQTFFIGFGNWDGHSNLVANHELLLSQVNLAIKEFWAEMVAQGLQDKVTIFTGSDFARTLRSNGSGTDHAWGGNAFVVGGGLNGGGVHSGSKIHGNYPDILKLGQGLDTGTNGRLLPTTGVDPYYADLLLWLGVSKSELPLVLPNIGNFYDVTSSAPPLGLFA